METLKQVAGKTAEGVYNAMTSFASRSLVLLFILIVLSTAQLFFYGFVHDFPENPFLLLVMSWLNDATFWLKYNVLFCFVYLICYFIRPWLARILMNCFFSAFAIAHLMLMAYFSTASVPLGADLLGYSKEDITQALGSSSALSFSNILCGVFMSTLIIILFSWLPNRLKIHRYLAVIITITSLLFLLVGFSSTPDTVVFKSDFTNNLVLNKSDFFYSEMSRNLMPENIETDIYSEGYLGVFSEGNSKWELADVKYSDEENYPFLHVDSSADVLAPFFNKSSTPPNIVIIVIEGLGRAFSNERAYLGSFTPFLDSLAGKGLYFNNFLSAGGRTFAVLPSLLASLPLAENGFLELGNKMPEHLSLLTLLKTSGYHTSFYYGGDSRFDNMDIFLRKNRIDELNDGGSFPKGYTKLPAFEGFTWGYNDKELYRRYLDTRDQDAAKPQLSILLTVSSHSPFLISEQGKYLSMFNKRLADIKVEKLKIKNYQSYRQQYASILYADDALRGFFDKYRQRKDYNNTIFLITGDHRMPEISMNTKIDRYHVPLIVYSPLLKRTAKIESVSSHFDIAPSLLAFLHNGYGVKRPSLSSWIGQGIDTVRSFRNIHTYPLIQTKTNITDFIAGNYHLNNQTVYTIQDNMNEEIIHDQTLLDNLTASFRAYKIRNSRFMSGKKLLPDSIYKKYYPLK